MVPNCMLNPCPSTDPCSSPPSLEERLFVADGDCNRHPQMQRAETMEYPVLGDMATAVPAYEAQGTQRKWDRQKDWTSSKSQRTRKSALILCFLEMTGKLHTCHIPQQCGHLNKAEQLTS